MELGRATAIASRLGLALALLAGCGADPPLPTAPAPPVISVDPGLTPRLSPEQVAGIVFGQIESSERAVGRVVAPARIVRMTVTTSGAAGRVEPGTGSDVRMPNSIVWVVRAFGTFTNRRTPPGGEPGVAGSGFYVIADADGSILGFGFP